MLTNKEKIIEELQVKQSKEKKIKIYESRINKMFSNIKRELKNLKKYLKKNGMLKEKTRLRSGLLNYSDGIDSFFSILKKNEKNIILINNTNDEDEKIRIYGYIEISLVSLEKKIKDFKLIHKL